MHEIRLAGPWDSAISGAETWERQKLPYRTSGSHSDARIRRRFHRPTGLLHSSRVLLVVEASGNIGKVSVNDLPVAQTSSDVSDEPGRLLFDVTENLTEFNSVEIRLPSTTGSSPIVVHAVRLRIVEHSGA